MSEEAKFPAFYNMNFKSICLGMQYLDNKIHWMMIDKANHSSISNKTTLKSIFETDMAYVISEGRNAWKSLIDDSSLQPNCNREGFNLRGDGNELKLRIGIVSNQEQNCLTPESFLGFGSNMVYLCNPAIATISAGNFAACFSDNGDKSTPVFGFILIKWFCTLARYQPLNPDLLLA